MTFSFRKGSPTSFRKIFVQISNKTLVTKTHSPKQKHTRLAMTNKDLNNVGGSEVTFENKTCCKNHPMSNL